MKFISSLNYHNIYSYSLAVHLSRRTSNAVSDITNMGDNLKYVPLFTVRLLSVLLHLIGTCSLCCVYKKVRDKIQLLFLVNLSVVHALVVVLDIVRFKGTPFPSQRHADQLNEWEHGALIFRDTIEVLVYYMTVCLITVHRMMKIILGFRYHLFLTTSKTKILILFVWFCAFGVSTGICFRHHYHLIHYDIEKMFYRDLFMPLDVVYVILVISCYSCIFKKQVSSFNRSRRNNQTTTEGRARVKRVYYVPILLLMNFLVFAVIPDLVFVLYNQRTIFTCYSCFEVHIVDLLFYTSLVCHINDSIIYIFVHPHVRQFLLKKIKNCYTIVKHSDAFVHVSTIRSNRVNNSGIATSAAAADVNVDNNSINIEIKSIVSARPKS